MNNFALTGFYRLFQSTVILHCLFMV